MDPQRIERNSHLYEEILSELQQQNSMRSSKSHIVSNRKDYARLDIGSMGVDLKENFSTADKQSLLDTSPSESKTKSDQRPEKDDCKSKDVDDSTANIKHISGDLNSDDLYALPNKRKHHDGDGKVYEIGSEEECEEEEKGGKEESDGFEDKDANKDLPPGWEKHEDNNGPYYWHIKSGTIQREPPLWCKETPKELKTPVTTQQFLTTAIKSPINNNSFSNFYGSKDCIGNRIQESQSLSVTRSNTSSALDFDEDRRQKEDLAFKDFAYVARDRLTRIHMCHVFRCDTAARTIANTLRDICKRIMIERSLQLDANGVNVNGARCATRPTDLPTENRRWVRHPQSFPTPMEEPKKVLKAQYLGSTEVNQPTGMDVLNAAIDTALRDTKPEQWEHVNVSVAPSMISIHSSGDEGRLIAECRVRYLSFMGIGQNVKNCAFIMHTAEDKFVCHAFLCEPSSGALCKTIEAACKLRYQKCLDAHPENRLSSESSTPSKGIGATLKNLMNTFTSKKDKSTS